MGFSTLSYCELVGRVLHAGKVESDAAFEELINRLHHLILKLIRKFSISGHDEDDLFQECMMVIRFKVIPKWKDERSSFVTFSYRCIRQHLLKLVEQSKRWRNVSIDESLSLDYEYEDECLSDLLPSSKESILDQIERSEYFQMIFGKTYHSLSPKQKKVFLLFSQNRTYADIATMIDSTPKSVSCMIQMIRKKGKEIIENMEA